MLRILARQCLLEIFHHFIFRPGNIENQGILRFLKSSKLTFQQFCSYRRYKVYMLSDTEIIRILYKSKDATAIYDNADLRIRFVNEAMLKIWGKDNSIEGETLEKALPELPVKHLTTYFQGLLTAMYTLKAVCWCRVSLPV